MKLFLLSFLHLPYYSLSLGPKYLPQYPILKHHHSYLPSLNVQLKYHTHVTQQAKCSSLCLKTANGPKEDVGPNHSKHSPALNFLEHEILICLSLYYSHIQQLSSTYYLFIVTSFCMGSPSSDKNLIKL